MHPDQYTPDSHRYTTPDSVADQHKDGDAPAPPELEQQAEEDLDTTDTTVSTPETDGARVAEAGNAYVGRMMDDDLKSSPRVEDGDEAVDEDPTTARDD